MPKSLIVPKEHPLYHHHYRVERLIDPIKRETWYEIQRLHNCTWETMDEYANIKDSTTAFEIFEKLDRWQDHKDGFFGTTGNHRRRMLLEKSVEHDYSKAIITQLPFKWFSLFSKKQAPDPYWVDTINNPGVRWSWKIIKILFKNGDGFMYNVYTPWFQLGLGRYHPDKN